MYTNIRKETYIMTLKQAITTEILKNLEREILNSSDTNFQFAVKYYLSSYTTKYEFEHSHFFEEFQYDPSIQEMLLSLYNKVSYCEFRKLLNSLSREITVKLITDDSTPYYLLAQLASYVTADYCERIARKSKSDNLKFLATFKTLELCFMIAPDKRNVSNDHVCKCKQWMKKFSHPSPKILGILDDPAEALKVNVDDNWLVNELVSSL